MTIFPAYAASFELYPKSGEAFQHLSPLLDKIESVNFVLSISDPRVNQGQMISTFDAELENKILSLGASLFDFIMPAAIPQEHDFAFSYSGQKVAVEIEKANREKILRDFLKCHMYLQLGADLTIVVLPKNYSHKLGSWNLFEFGVQRYNECLTFGFGTPESLGRILLLGFEQFCATTNELMTKRIRDRMRKESIKEFEGLHRES